MGPPRNETGPRDPFRSIISGILLKWNIFFFKGGITGGIEICITYPTEYVKTMMQLYKEYS